jgi:5'-3' exonuclease
VPGWGAKSAAAVLARFPRLEAIPHEPRELGLPAGRAARLVESLAEHRDDALLYRRLATLRYDVPLRQGVGDLEWRGPAAGLGALCVELGDDELALRAAAVHGASAGGAR